MMLAWWIANLVLVPLQIPRPFSGESVARELHAEYRKILETEASELDGLAVKLDGERDVAGARAIRARLPRPSEGDGPTRFRPLPDVVPPADPGRRSPAESRAEEI